MVLSWLDWVLVTIMILSLISGFRSGFLKTLLGALKYLISFILILLYAPQFGGFLTGSWNLTQNIALSLRDMVNLPGNLYTETLEITTLSQRIQMGNFPIEEFSNSLKYIISNLELPQTLRDMMNSFMNNESIIEYLLRINPDFTGYPINNMEELVFYTVGSFIARLIAISIGAIVIITVVFLLTHFIISLFHKITDENAGLNMLNRFLGGFFNLGICFLVLIFLLEIITPLLFYFMIDPSQSMMLSIILNTSFHIRPWLKHVIMHM